MIRSMNRSRTGATESLEPVLMNSSAVKTEKRLIMAVRIRINMLMFIKCTLLVCEKWSQLDDNVGDQIYQSIMDE